MEQAYLFLFDGDYIQEHLMSVGGFSYLVAAFLNQFFIYPFAGAAITATLLVTVAIFTRNILKRISPQAELPVFYLLPATFLMFIQFHFNYYLQGSVAFLICLLFLYIYLLLSSLSRKMIYLLPAVPVLFWLGGSVGLLLVSVVLVKELITHPRQSFWFLIPCAEALLLAMLSVRAGWVGEFRFAILPDMYFNYLIKPDSGIIYLSWASLLLAVMVASFLHNRKGLTGKKLATSIVVQLLLILFVAGYRHINHLKDDTLKYKQLEYYNRTAQWDEIVKISNGPIKNYLYACYLNRALAEKGELGNRIFEFDQPGIEGLMIKWTYTYPTSRLLSDIFFTFGSIAAAQEKGFEANLNSPDGNSAYTLQRLVQTGIILGEYAVAQKYMDILSSTLYYREWADSHRRFLFNDEAVAADSFLGNKRRFLTTNTFYQGTGLLEELAANARTNPQDKTAIEYLGAAYLLAKSIEPFGQMLASFYDTGVLPVLPRSFQEAAVIVYEKERESWPRLGISAQTIERFGQFEQFIRKNKGRPNLDQGAKQYFGDTYWYYFIFK